MTDFSTIKAVNITIDGKEIQGISLPQELYSRYYDILKFANAEFKCDQENINYVIAYNIDNDLISELFTFLICVEKYN